jgi:hypothetical protein
MQVFPEQDAACPGIIGGGWRRLGPAQRLLSTFFSYALTSFIQA